jgi:putative ABC transport system permease protein
MTRKGYDNIDDLKLSFLSSQQMIEAMDEMMGIFMMFLVGIAAISLLVGGIGIMNIMLVTVVERTREIGLRKALGAKKGTIVMQFLVEAMVLTILGGVVGFVLGLGLAALFCKIAGMAFVISWTGVALGVGVSSAIGLVFGIYPARKAASLQPIDALRFD